MRTNLIIIYKVTFVHIYKFIIALCPTISATIRTLNF